MASRVIEITQLKRLNNDPDGNPRWRVTAADGSTLTTVPGSQVGLTIDPTYQDVASIPANVTLNEKGLIAGIESA